VTYLLKSLARRAADTLSWRVGCDQSRMLAFKLLELVHQLVELGVRNFGIVEGVVTVFVMADLIAEGFDLLLSAFVFGRGHWGNYRRES
jgi:hypothetical protein